MKIIYQIFEQDGQETHKALVWIKRISVFGYGRTKVEARRDSRNEIRLYQVAIEDAARILTSEALAIESAIEYQGAQISNQPESGLGVVVPTTEKFFNSEKFRVAAEIFVRQCQNGEIDDPMRLGQKLYDVYYRKYNGLTKFYLASSEIVRNYNEFAARLLTLNGADGTLLDELIARGPSGRAEST